MFEVEQKYHVDSVATFRGRVTSLGGVWQDIVRQVDRYFSHPKRDFAKTDEALRVRISGKTHKVTYKGPKVDDTTKTRREIELVLAETPDAASRCGELFLALGFHQVAVVQKARHIAEIMVGEHKFEVCLDDVDGLGQFVELETSATEGELGDARQAMQTLANQLHLTHSERRSYLELLLEGV